MHNSPSIITKIPFRLLVGVGVLIIYTAIFLFPRAAHATVCLLLLQNNTCQEFATTQEANDAGVANHSAGRGGFSAFCGACTQVPACPGSTATTNPPNAGTEECAVVPGAPGAPPGLQPIRGNPVIGFTNPICRPGQPCTPQIILGNIIRSVLGIVGSIALLMFIIGGFTWMIAGGNTEKVKKSRDIMIWAGLGLLVIFAAYIITNFIITAFAS